MVLFNCAVANAQSDTTVVAKSNDFAAQLFSASTSQTCSYLWVEDGVMHTENCNGWIISPVAGVSHLSYKNDTEKGTATAAKFGVQAGYRYRFFRPEVAFYYTASMTVESRSYTAPELQVAINFDFNHHSRVNIFVAPTFGYKFVQSKADVSNEVFEGHIDYDGNVELYGAKAGAMIKLGTTQRNVTAVINNQKLTAKKHSQWYLKIEANYQTGKVNKPNGDVLKMNEIFGNIGVVYKF